MKTTITKTKVPDDERMEFLPRKLGKLFLKFEMSVYAHMDNLCPEYRGGFWEFYDLSNGGFYMAYDHEESLRVVFPFNYFDEEMSADAASIAANLFALNSLTWDTRSEQAIDAFYALRDFAAEHPEGAKIMRVID